MSIFRSFLGFLSRRLTWGIFAVMLLGLLVSGLGGGIPFNLGICATASFLMIYPMFINLRLEDLSELPRHKAPVGLALFLNFVISPALAWGLSQVFLANQPYLALGLMLISLVPTSGMTATWTEISHGNLKVALSIIAASLVIVIVGLPLALPLFAGKVLTVGPLFILARVALVIVIPLVLGDVTRRLLIAKKGSAAFKKLKPVFSGLSSLGLMAVLFLIMALNTNKALLQRPDLVLTLLPPLLLYYGLMFSLSTLLASRLAYPTRVAVVYGTSVRYLALALGIAVPLLGSGSNSSLVVLSIALAFFIQVPFSSLYAKIIVRWHRPAASESLSEGS